METELEFDLIFGIGDCGNNEDGSGDGILYNPNGLTFINGLGDMYGCGFAMGDGDGSGTEIGTGVGTYDEK